MKITIELELNNSSTDPEMKDYVNEIIENILEEIQEDIPSVLEPITNYYELELNANYYLHEGGKTWKF